MQRSKDDDTMIMIRMMMMMQMVMFTLCILLPAHRPPCLQFIEYFGFYTTLETLSTISHLISVSPVLMFHPDIRIYKM